MKTIVFLSRTGCLLPLLIVLNLLFGWVFIKPTAWLILELVLILMFVLNFYMITKKVTEHKSKRDNVIDTEGHRLP